MAVCAKVLLCVCVRACACAPLQMLMSSHTEKLHEVEIELRTLRTVRDEVETLRASLETIRTRVNSLELARGTAGSGPHTLGQSAHATHTLTHTLSTHTNQQIHQQNWQPRPSQLWTLRQRAPLYFHFLFHLFTEREWKQGRTYHLAKRGSCLESLLNLPPVEASKISLHYTSKTC